MLLIGESLNVISKKIGAAFKQRDPKPIQEEALFQREKGMDYIDINLGPAKKDGHELMPWVVQTVQEVVDDVPLALDTSNIDAIAAALKVYKDTPQPPLINSIMVRPERYEPMVPVRVPPRLLGRLLAMIPVPPDSKTEVRRSEKPLFAGGIRRIVAQWIGPIGVQPLLARTSPAGEAEGQDDLARVQTQVYQAELIRYHVELLRRLFGVATDDERENGP